MAAVGHVALVVVGLAGLLEVRIVARQPAIVATPVVVVLRVLAHVGIHRGDGDANGASEQLRQNYAMLDEGEKG